MTELFPFVALLIGYYFQSAVHYLRFRSNTFPWERRVLEATISGAVLSPAFLLMGRLLVSGMNLIFGTWPIMSTVKATLQFFFPIRFAGTMMVGVILLLVTPLFISHFLPREASLQRAVEQHGDDLRHFLFNTEVNQRPVIVTLESRYVYAGFIVKLSVLERGAEYLTILPLMRGYISEPTLRVNFSTDHWERLEAHITGEDEGDADELQLVLRLDQVITAEVFDPHRFLGELANHSVESETK